MGEVANITVGVIAEPPFVGDCALDLASFWDVPNVCEKVSAGLSIEMMHLLQLALSPHFRLIVRSVISLLTLCSVPPPSFLKHPPETC